MKIHAIQTGEVQIKTRQVEARRESRPARILDTLRDREWTSWVPILCWAIEHPEGIVMVDSGESSRAGKPGYQPGWDLYGRFAVRFSVTPEQESGPQLKALGLDPADVRWVVMTHMHGDHAGGLSHFPSSEIVMSEREAAAALARTGPLNGYHNKHYPQWLAPRRVAFDSGPWESFDASSVLTADGAVRIVPTPGHTNGHLSVAVEDGGEVVLLAGDTTYLERTLLSGAVDGVCDDARAHCDSTARLRELCRRRSVIYLPTHDPESATRLLERAATTAPA
jgi:glyoxylase-like metal-dependent hydrolase (beta-lactamase superfamily II)